MTYAIISHTAKILAAMPSLRVVRTREYKSRRIQYDIHMTDTCRTASGMIATADWIRITRDGISIVGAGYSSGVCLRPTRTTAALAAVCDLLARLHQAALALAEGKE